MDSVQTKIANCIKNTIKANGYLEKSGPNNKAVPKFGVNDILSVILNIRPYVISALGWDKSIISRFASVENPQLKLTEEYVSWLKSKPESAVQPVWIENRYNDMLAPVYSGTNSDGTLIINENSFDMGFLTAEMGWQFMSNAIALSIHFDALDKIEANWAIWADILKSTVKDVANTALEPLKEGWNLGKILLVVGSVAGGIILVKWLTGREG